MSRGITGFPEFVVGSFVLMIAAMVGEKAFQIDFVSTLRVFGKANGTKQPLVGAFAAEKGAMHTAKINEIQGASTHDEHGFKVTAFLIFRAIRDLGKVVEKAALVGHFELTDPYQIIVNAGGVGKEIGAIGDLTFLADLLLLLLGLNGENL